MQLLTGIWVGYWGHGLDRLDPSTGNFKHFRYNQKDINSLSSDSVGAILEDREGVLWIGTQKGLNRYDQKTGKFQHYYHNPDDPYSLSCNQVTKIFEDRAGTCWVGTGGITQGEGGETDEGGLNCFDKKTGKFIRFVHDPDDPHSLINNKVTDIFEDSRGTFWVGTAGDGLHTMDRANGRFEWHFYDSAHPEKLSRPPQKKIRQHTPDHIRFIIEDAAGAIWIGTYGNGINRYDPQTKKVTYYPNFKDPVSGMQLEVPWWACTSRDGMLWIGYFRGLYRIDPLRKNIPYFATGTSVDEIYEDRFGVLWYGTIEGLVRKDRNTGTEKRFVNDPLNPKSISNKSISAIYEDHQGVLWIGTAKGLNRFDRKTGTFVRHLFNSSGDSSLINEGVGSIYEDRQGYFWIGTSKQIICINRQTNTLTHYRHNPADTSSLSKGGVYQIYEDNSGSLWFATYQGSLNRFIPQTGKFQRFLNGPNIHSLWQDSEGVLWLGTSRGLYRSNPDLNGFSRFTGPNGEFTGNMIVNGVLEDDKKNLWINASMGLCRLSSKRNEVLTFSRQETRFGIMGRAAIKARAANFFLVAEAGILRFFRSN